MAETNLEENYVQAMRAGKPVLLSHPREIIAEDVTPIGSLGKAVCIGYDVQARTKHFVPESGMSPEEILEIRVPVDALGIESGKFVHTSPYEQVHHRAFEGDAGLGFRTLRRTLTRIGYGGPLTPKK
jgi:hypothetical protein